LRETINPADYRLEGAIRVPRADADATISATATEDADAMQFRFDDTHRAGIYRLRLARRDQMAETRGFAVNIDPDEGDLRPLDAAAFKALEAIDNVRVSSGRVGDRRSAGLQRMELWRPILIALIGALCVEQLFGWWLGRRRG
jgi:hypothetical protein